MAARRKAYRGGLWRLAQGTTLAAALSSAACGDERAAPELVAGRDVDGGSPEAGSPPASGEVVGTQCRSDGDCGSSLRCLLSTGDDLAPGLGGPPHGLCSKPCVLPGDCEGPVPSACGSPFDGAPTFCLPTCTPGVAEDPASKCLGRLDLACQGMTDGSTGGLCVPACGGPSDCAGRRCDLGTGMCTDIVATGLPLGADCSAGPCESGVCIDLEGFPVCSGTCAIGTPSCGFDPGSPARLEAYCFYSPDPAASQRDLGLCAKLCDCDADCGREDFVCAPGPEDSMIVLSARGRRGVCTPVPIATAHLDCTADAGIDDGGAPDARAPDARAPDARAPDARAPDARAPDAGN